MWERGEGTIITYHPVHTLHSNLLVSDPIMPLKNLSSVRCAGNYGPPDFRVVNRAGLWVATIKLVTLR